MIAKVKACSSLVFKWGCRTIKIPMKPVKTNITPMYLVRQASAAENEKSNKELAFFFCTYIEKEKSDKTTKKIKVGSDQAMKETDTNGIDTSKEAVPKNASSGDKFLRNTKPERYRINPKKIAPTKFADNRGSMPNKKSILPKIAGYIGGCANRGELS